MARQKQSKPVHQMTPAQFDALVKTEDDCKAYLVARRWPQGVRCPRCGNDAVYSLHARAWHWQCTQCAPGGNTGYRFSYLTGTIFENTNKPLKDWFRVAHLMLVSKKGMSALQIYRYMGFGSYKTAWLMCHKIRTAMVEDVRQLAGIVEVDETVVGGDSSNRHWDKRSGKGNKEGKSIVVGAVRRKVNIVARVVENVKGATLTAFVNEAVSHKVSLICTDEWPGYNRLAENGNPHKTVGPSGA
jgi:transposase-like protein